MKSPSTTTQTGLYVLGAVVGLYLLGAVLLLVDVYYFNAYWYLAYVPEPMAKVVEVAYMPLDYLLRMLFRFP